MKKSLPIILLLASCAICYGSTNEITVTASLKVSKDSIQISRTSGTKLVQMAGHRYNTQVLALTTNLQSLTAGSVVTNGWCYLRNLGTGTNDATTADISFDGGVTPALSIKSGEPALFRMSKSTVVTNIKASASVDTTDLEFTIIED